jgi:hypothetical protein
VDGSSDSAHAESSYIFQDVRGTFAVLERCQKSIRPIVTRLTSEYHWGSSIVLYFLLEFPVPFGGIPTAFHIGWHWLTSSPRDIKAETYLQESCPKPDQECFRSFHWSRSQEFVSSRSNVWRVSRSVRNRVCKVLVWHTSLSLATTCLRRGYAQRERYWFRLCWHFWATAQTECLPWKWPKVTLSQA